MSDLASGVRTSVQLVEEIFDTEMTNDELHTAINIANRFVTANLGSTGLAAATLTDIETFLAAHFASLKDPRAKSENIAGEYSYTVQGETGKNLDATYYGQMAKMLDTTGTLDTIAANLKKATIHSASIVNTLPEGWQNNPL